MASATLATMTTLLLPTTTTPPNSINFSARELSSSHSQTLGGGGGGGLSSPSLLISASPSLSPFVYCGRGDRKTAKGKRFNHSFGNARPRNKKKGRGPPRIPVPSSPTKKDPFEDAEVVKIDIDESNH